METLRTKLEDVRQSAIDNIKRMVKPGERVTLCNELNVVYCDCVGEVAVVEHIRMVECSNSGDLYAVYSNEETQDTSDLSCYPTENIIALCEEVAHSRTNAAIQRIKEILDGKLYVFPLGQEVTWQDEYNGTMYRCASIKPCEVTDEFPLGLQFEVNVNGDDENWGLWGELPIATMQFLSKRVDENICKKKIQRIKELLGGNITFAIPQEENVSWIDPSNGEEVKCDLVSVSEGNADFRVSETRNNGLFGHLSTAPIECLDKIISIIEKDALDYYKRLMDLTDEQQKAFSDFIAARNRLKELGVIIFRDETDCVDYIFNGTNFESIDVFCTEKDKTDPRNLDISNLLGLFEYDGLCDTAFHTDGYSFYGRLKEGVSI